MGDQNAGKLNRLLAELGGTRLGIAGVRRPHAQGRAPAMGGGWSAAWGRNDALDGGAGNATVSGLGGMTRMSTAQATTRWPRRRHLVGRVLENW